MSRAALAGGSLAAGLVLTLLGGAQVVAQAAGPGQPWSPLLHDNVVFARSLFFLIGFGLFLGAAQALLLDPRQVDRRPGWVRRFAPSTALTHWLNALGFLAVYRPLSRGTLQSRRQSDCGSVKYEPSEPSTIQ